jgi:phage terminase large subunit
MALSQEERAIRKTMEWQYSPVQWVREVLGETPTFQQEAALHEWGLLIRAKVKSAKGAPLTDEEKPYRDKLGMSIQSGQDSGKTHFAGWIGLHMHVCFPYSKVRVTAPAGPQIESVMWPEFHKLIRGSELLTASITHRATKIYRTQEGGAEWFIEPRTIQKNSSPDEQAEVLGGLHEKYMVMIADEASGVPDPVFKPLEGGLGGVCNLILLIFNPTRSHGYAMESQSKYRKHWVCHHWDCEELAKTHPVFAPHMTQDHARIAEKYGKDSNFYRIRVKGLPPLAAPDVLIPWDWVMDATLREAEVDPLEPLTIGVDVGGKGDDSTVIIPGRGNVIIPYSTTIPIFAINDIDPTQVAWKVEGCIADLLETEEGQYAIAVDGIGVGAGVASHLRRVAQLRNIYDVNVAEMAAEHDRFHRLRDEIWWMAREAFSDRLISIPNDDELIGELTDIHYDDESGKIKVEGKKDLKKRGVKSPNKADAFCLREYARRFCISRIPRQAQRTRQRAVAVPWQCT